MAAYNPLRNLRIAKDGTAVRRPPVRPTPANRNQAADAANRARAQQFAQRQAQRQQTPRRPGVPAGAPAAPAPAAPTYGAQALAPDGTYTAQTAGNVRSYQNNLAGIQYQEGVTRKAYGIDDPSDPFSKAALLQQTYTRNQNQRLNTAGNNLYSSAFTAGETEGRNQFDQSNAALRADYANKLNQYAQQRAQAAIDLEQGNTQAYGDMISRAPTPEDPGPLPAAQAAAGGAGAAAAAKAGARGAKATSPAQRRQADQSARSRQVALSRQKLQDALARKGRKAVGVGASAGYPAGRPTGRGRPAGYPTKRRR